MLDFNKKIIMLLLISASICPSEQGAQGIKQSDNMNQAPECILATQPACLNSKDEIITTCTVVSTEVSLREARERLQQALYKRELFMQQFLAQNKK